MHWRNRIRTHALQFNDIERLSWVAEPFFAVSNFEISKWVRGDKENTHMIPCVAVRYCCCTHRKHNDSTMDDSFFVNGLESRDSH